MRLNSNSNQSYFVKTPYPLLFLYPFIDGYKAEYTTLYGLLVHYYNDEKGYAWPNVDTLAMYYGKSVKTTSEHLTALYNLGLIDRRKVGVKYQFRPLRPLDGTAFFKRFPQAEAVIREREKKREAERKRSAENMAKMDDGLAEWF